MLIASGFGDGTRGFADDLDGFDHGKQQLAVFDEILFFTAFYKPDGFLGGFEHVSQSDDVVKRHIGSRLGLGHRRGSSGLARRGYVGQPFGR